MKRLLLIEKSATLRHALARQFPSEDYDTQAVATYEEALTRLKDPGEHFDAVILGWPEQAAAITDELLVMLGQDPYRQMAVVVLSDTHESAQVNWITERPGTALLLWEEHHEIREVLNRVWRRLPKADEIDTTVPGESGDTRGIRILLVDDSPTARYTYRNLLTQNGYEVTTAGSVEEGFERAAAESFDIAIIDYFMPGETGDVLCQRLRQDPRTHQITVSVLTGTYVDHVIADNLAAGAVECMFKNESDELFLARVAAMSRSIRARRSVERERRHLEGILSSVGDGVFGVDTAGRLSFMNPIARKILGFRRSDRVVGENARSLIHYADADGRTVAPDQCFLTRAYASGERLTNWQTHFWTKNGRPVPVEGTVYPLTIDGERQGSVVAFRDITERRLLEDQLRWQANHDALTRLLNRHYFEHALHQEVKRISRSGGMSALVFVDLDQFKYINDTAGHGGGDQLLLEVSQRLSARLRGSDTLARLGGDEFALLLHDQAPDKLERAGDTFRQVLADTAFVYAGTRYTVTASVGVAPIDAHIGSAGTAMARADLAAQIAKQEGRNRTHVYSAEDADREGELAELGWSHRLRQALDQDEFALVFQPVAPSSLVADEPAAADGAARWASFRAQIGQSAHPWHYEVLLRLPEADAADWLPGAFLPAAERFGLMPAIDRWTVDAALQRLARTAAAGMELPRLAINLSGATLAETEFAGYVQRLLGERDLPAACLAFEVSESAATANLDGARRLIRELAELGCYCGLDHFGSGFCSFADLRHLEVDYLKIDGVFAQGLVSDPLDRQVVTAIAEIAHAVGKASVAECVESQEAMRVARQCGVDLVQGHCLAEPIAEIPDLLTDAAA